MVVVLAVFVVPWNLTNESVSSSQQQQQSVSLVPSGVPTVSWAPTGQPSMVPSSAPTPWDPRKQGILELIQNQTLLTTPLSFPSAEATNPTTEEAALAWILNQDSVAITLDPLLDSKRILQRYALATLWFFQLTTGSEWNSVAQTAWLTDAHECDWAMVECEELFFILGTENTTVTNNQPEELLCTLISCAQRVDVVRRFSITQQGLKGQLSHDVGLLSHLTISRLSKNELYGTIPSSMTYLTDLEVWDLQSNALTGPIPEAVGTLTNLEWWILDNNLLDGTLPSSIVHLIKLEDWQFSNNQLSGAIPEEITSLTNLKFLVGERNGFTGVIPTGIGQLTNIISFDLSSNPRLSGPIPSDIARFTNVEFLFFLTLL